MCDAEVRLIHTTDTRFIVMVETVWLKAGIVREAALVLGGSLLIAAAAQLQIVLPFSPVPITAQTFAVLLIAALFGSKRGSATVFTYLTVGALGLPVFAGGAFGIMRLVGPTAGYLAGFLAAAFVVGLLSERGWDRKLWTAATSMIVGNAIIYAAGILWLSRFVGWEAVLRKGFLPFLPGDALKIVLATVLLPTGWTFIGRSNTRFVTALPRAENSTKNREEAEVP
ncbi:MAG: biotin transporter BioY [Anaerolineales bacterium]|nr:biotin transporter BioY [Anaerolineales bacterium]HJN41543.1 biotin transporter BioY [Anaerolineales bacterium]